MKKISIHHDVFTWTLWIIPHVFQNFDCMEKYLPGICSLGHFQNIDFRGAGKHFIFNVFWWEHVWFHVLFSLELYQLLLFILKTLIILRNLGFEFSLKVIFRRWMFRGDSKHFILIVFWGEHVWYLFWNFCILWDLKFFVKIFFHITLFNEVVCKIFPQIILVLCRIFH